MAWLIMWSVLHLMVVSVQSSPFVVTLETLTINQSVTLFYKLFSQSNVNISWGDNSTSEFQAATNNSLVSHTFSVTGRHNVSVFGEFRFEIIGFGSRQVLVDIASWGGLILDHTTPIYLFGNCPNLRVSAPANSQPLMLPGTSLENMFFGSAFDSPLNWDLINVTSIAYMFGSTPLSQPITFSNTPGVVSLEGVFTQTNYFNHPFSFDCSSVTNLANMFFQATAFNSSLNLTNTRQVATTYGMFWGAHIFNQPITFQTDSVTDMRGMFAGTPAFNQPVNLNTSQVTTMASMFAGAASFSQSLTMDTRNVRDMGGMLARTPSFSGTLNFTSTASVTIMTNFIAADDGNKSVFTQNLVGWDTRNVIACDSFCALCGLPSFPRCNPCASTFSPSAPRFNITENLTVCATATSAPTTSTPTTGAPTTLTPSAAPTKTMTPTTATPTTPAVSAAKMMNVAPLILLCSLWACAL